MKAKWICLAIACIMIISVQSYAGIPVSGVVNGTWTQGDTMDVVGDLFIVSGDTLTIEPAVVVKFMDYYRFYVYGLLLADGIASDSIYFTCDLIQNPNKWGGIRFSNADSLCSMSYCSIENGWAQNPEADGGGVYCSNSSPTLTHCAFRNNQANSLGGGIAIHNNSSPIMNNCFFSNNSSNNGGAIRIVNSSPAFRNSSISNNFSSNNGGGVFCDGNSSVQFVNCQINGNYAANEDGGGITCYNSSLTLDSCDVINNHLSGGYGDDGAGINSDNSNLILTDCNITGNYNSYWGGGIALYSNISLNMANCEISGNSANDRGGGITFYSSSDNIITDCTISHNSASNYGGGIHLYLSTIGLTNCEFSYNSAMVSGGGMYINRWWASMSNCTFIVNSAPGQYEGDGGGGIYVADYRGGMDLTNCIFEGNTAYRGGGIYGYSWSSNSTIDTCSFINNIADPQGGGAIYNSGANVSITECEFEGNQCTGYGGGISNSEASPNISRGIFEGNNASYGGAVSNYGGSPTIVRCTLYDNSANSGGGIACVSCSVAINSTIISSCSTGSGIYFGPGSNRTKVKYCDFYGNEPLDFSGSDIPSGLGQRVSTNVNGDSCDTFFNIFLDPLFVDAANGDFHLSWANDPIPDSTKSPCIDAGDPTLPHDPENTIADIGRYYYHQRIPPVADADGPYAGVMNEPLAFNGSGSQDLDGTIISYDWDFGDGNTGTGVNPSHAYANYGTFEVILTVTDDDGLTDKDTTTADIGSRPIADINGPYAGVLLDTTQFDGSGSQDLDGTIIYYHWDFGDGNTGTGVNPIHVYANYGTFEVILTVTDDDDLTGKDTTTVDIKSPPTANANGPYGGALPDTIQFDGSGSQDPDGTIISYEWDFGDGSTGTGEFPKHAYADTGTYQVVLKVTDDDSLTAKDTTSVSMRVGVEIWHLRNVPDKFELSQNYPNPFNPETAIWFDIPRAGQVSLRIYNVTGQLLRELADGHWEAGSYEVRWDGRDEVGREAASGVYFCRMKAVDFGKTIKMMLLR